MFEHWNRPIHFGTLPSLADWPRHRPPPLQDFALLLLVDSMGIPDAELEAFARLTVSQGMTYLCVWGPDCERFHDLVDQVVIQREILLGRQGTPDERFVLTTWHDKDTLDQAIFYFLNCADPLGQPLDSSDCWAAVVVGRGDWAEHVRSRLADPGGDWTDGTCEGRP